LTDDASVPQDAQLLAGEIARSGRAGGPPARPPPPRLAGSQTATPAHVVAKPAPKTAFDDLDDSIRAAFGGSPSQSIPVPGASAVGLQGPQQPVAGIFGSPSQQHAFALNTEMFSSSVKGVSNVDSSIGEGSL
jgi:hypothetical protein